MRSFRSFSVTIALVAALASTASAQTCTVCGTAANNFTNTKAKYNKLTCQELQVDLDGLGGADLCDAVLNGNLYNWFQHESFCGCEGVTAPETCQLCADDEMIAFPTAYVPWDHAGEGRYTCAEAAELARHVSDSTTCTDVVATTAVKEACCRKIGSVCPVCEGGANFKAENRYGNITCGAIANDTYAMDKLQCGAYYNQDTHYWMNWQTFCGCEGSKVPDKTCTLCGSNMIVIHPEKIVPWENETDVYTCAQASELAQHISDNDVCVDDVQTAAVKAACCTYIDPITGKSAAFTPSQVVSAAAGFMMAMLLLAM